MKDNVYNFKSQSTLLLKKYKPSSIKTIAHRHMEQGWQNVWLINSIFRFCCIACQDQGNWLLNKSNYTDMDTFLFC